MPWSNANYDDSGFLDTGALFIASLMGSRSQMAWCKNRHHALYMPSSSSSSSSFFFFFLLRYFLPKHKTLLIHPSQGRQMSAHVGIGSICVDNMLIMKLSCWCDSAGLAVHDSVGGPRQCGLSGELGEFEGFSWCDTREEWDSCDRWESDPIF